MDAYLVADLMLYTIEIAQTYSSEKEIKQEAFLKVCSPRLIRRYFI
jgi:hypothetical protein